MEKFSTEWFADQRARSIEWAQGVLAHGDFLILDTETTGLGPDAEIIEIAILYPDSHIHIEQRIKPKNPVSPEASAVHGITTDDLAHCPTWPDVHRSLSTILETSDDRLRIIYNADYDSRLLDQSAAQWGLTFHGPIPFYCAMRQYSRYVGDWWPHKDDWKWQRLPALDGQKAHSALADCRSTLALIERMARGT